MIETICRAINLTPVYIEPGCCVREFNTESVQLVYMIPSKYGILRYEDIKSELTKVRNQMYEDLANLSYKGKVFYNSSYNMDSITDRCVYIVFDCLKIVKEISDE